MGRGRGQGESGSRSILLGKNRITKKKIPLFLNNGVFDLDVNDPGFLTLLSESVDESKFFKMSSEEIKRNPGFLRLYKKFTPDPEFVDYCDGNQEVYFNHFLHSLEDYFKTGRPVYFDQPVLTREGINENTDTASVINEKVFYEYINNLITNQRDFEKFYNKIIPSYKALKDKGIERDIYPAIRVLTKMFYNNDRGAFKHTPGKDFFPTIKRTEFHLTECVPEKKRAALKDSWNSKLLAEKEISRINFKKLITEGNLNFETAEEEYFRGVKAVLSYMFVSVTGNNPSLDPRTYLLTELNKEVLPSEIFKKLSPLFNEDDVYLKQTNQFYLREIEENKSKIDALDADKIVLILGEASLSFWEDYRYSTSASKTKTLETLIEELHKI